MDIGKLLEAAINGGIAVVLAVVVIYWYRSDSKERIADEKARTEEAKARTMAEMQRNDQMIRIIEQNTSAFTRLEEAVRALSEKMG